VDSKLLYHKQCNNVDEQSIIFKATDPGELSEEGKLAEEADKTLEHSRSAASISKPVSPSEKLIKVTVTSNTLQSEALSASMDTAKSSQPGKVTKAKRMHQNHVNAWNPCKFMTTMQMHHTHVNS
jgi:23S rRNA pseudoU1915 N3-methylase RlmH